MKGRPLRLYRYVDSATAWECLKEGTLAFTPPARFNDPFDTNPALDLVLNDQQLRALAAEGPPGTTLNLRSIEPAMRKNRREFMETLMGVACFSSKANDPLLWAHYGDRHRGVMIGFDATHSELSGAKRVSYSHKRPFVDIDAQGVSQKLLIKSRVWKMEDEWRMSAWLSKCDIKMISNTPVYIQLLDRTCFASITFGCKAEESVVVAVSNGLKHWNLKHCETWRVRLSETTYDLIPERIAIT